MQIRLDYLHEIIDVNLDPTYLQNYYKGATPNLDEYPQSKDERISEGIRTNYLNLVIPETMYSIPAVKTFVVATAMSKTNSYGAISPSIVYERDCAQSALNNNV